jgi:hypothetical protein
MKKTHRADSDTRSIQDRIRGLADRLTFVQDKAMQKAIVRELQLEIADVYRHRRRLTCNGLVSSALMVRDSSPALGR